MREIKEKTDGQEIDQGMEGSVRPKDRCRGSRRMRAQNG